MSLKASDHLTFATLLGLLNLKGLYTLGFSLIFGACESIQLTAKLSSFSHYAVYTALWVTFFGGKTTPQVLPFLTSLVFTRSNCL